jgi:calcium-dependent protein kinase
VANRGAAFRAARRFAAVTGAKASKTKAHKADMGCGGSKDDTTPTAAPADVAVDAGAGGHQRDARNSTKTGYLSDVAKKSTHTITEGLMTDHAKDRAKIDSVYDTSQSIVLGKGACGSVSTVRRKADGEVFACKTIAIERLEDNDLELLRNEIAIQRGLDHPNIVRIYESFEDHRKREMYIIMEMCTGGALVSRMKTHRHGYGEKAAATLVEKMLSATFYCHQRGVVHRDIKLDNFIYEDEAEDAELKLIDFGFAVEVAPGREAMWEQIGTPSYMAPELWADHAKEYDSSVDMWAIGVVTYMLLSGKRPFHHQVRAEKARMIKHDPLKFPSPDWDHISPTAKDFCKALMQKAPRDRMNAKDAMNHPWIKERSTVHQGETAATAMQKHQDVCDSLQAFSTADEMKKVALEVLAFTTPPAKLDELREMFFKMDEDDSGTISFAEFEKAMSKHPEISMTQLKQIFHDMDVSRSGEVEYNEFLAATLSTQKKLDKPSIKTAFQTLDRDGNGYVDVNDLKAILGKDKAYTEKELAEIVEHTGYAKDGKLYFADFMKLMVKGAKQGQEHALFRMTGSLADLGSASLSESGK